MFSYTYTGRVSEEQYGAEKYGDALSRIREGVSMILYSASE